MVSSDEKLFLKKLGLRLREVRHSRGWTLEETEEHGIKSWRHLQDIESGRNVTILSLRKISKVYKIKLEDLLSKIE